MRRLALGQGHGAVLVAQTATRTEWRCPACGLRFGYWRVPGKTWPYAEDHSAKGRPATGLKEALTLLRDKGHIVEEEYKVDPIYGVDSQVLGVWLSEVFHRPGVKIKGGSREKVKGKGTPKIKLGTRWWQVSDPWEMARETQALASRPKDEAMFSAASESGPDSALPP